MTLLQAEELFVKRIRQKLGSEAATQAENVSLLEIFDIPVSQWDESLTFTQRDVIEAVKIFEEEWDL